MAIITPTENNIYDCNNPTWFLDNIAVINFLSSQTKFTKETLPGLPFKITWDNSEHIINNPNNYSYQIFPLSGTYYITALATSNDTRLGCGATISVRTANVTGKFLGIIQGATANGRYTFPLAVINSFGNDGNSVRFFKTTNPLINHNLWLDTWVTACQNGFFNTDFLGTLNNNSLNFIPISAVNYYLKIIDNNITYEYPITNINSVQVINSIGQIKYKFFDIDNNIIIEKLENAEKTVKLQCGKDCPPGTCIKCRNFDLVCCYGSDGKVIEIINDPNFEIEAC
jgi:hypothetical protein